MVAPKARTSLRPKRLPGLLPSRPVAARASVRSLAPALTSKQKPTWTTQAGFFFQAGQGRPFYLWAEKVALVRMLHIDTLSLPLSCPRERTPFSNRS